MGMDAIDYRLHGEDMQFVEIELDPGEAAIGEGVVVEIIRGDAQRALRRRLGPGHREGAEE